MNIKKFIPSFIVSWYHFLLVSLGAVFYRFPAKKIKIIGITGTNGKSTVVEMTSKILEEAGCKTASLSSIKFKIGNKQWPNELRMTMPGRLTLQKFLRQAVNEKSDYIVLEVTSEGIKQHRHRFIDFEIAVFTNLTPEHIEAHGSFEKYKETKGELFRAAKKIHILNLDDENKKYFLSFPADKKYGYGLNSGYQPHGIEYLKAENIQATPKGIGFSVKDISFNLPLLGSFNIYNAIAAICVGLSQGISLETSKSALEKLKVIPGRMEEVISEPFKVFVDYAFTPNALQKAYETLSENSKFQIPNSKMVCVLGACGGGRDKWKRPVLGELAAKYCDEVIITNEDPYDEDPMEIINQIAEGAEGKAKTILDRREAIKKALLLAEPGDTVVITGKGCEPCICAAKGKKIPWDDREVVKEELEHITHYAL